MFKFEYSTRVGTNEKRQNRPTRLVGPTNRGPTNQLGSAFFARARSCIRWSALDAARFHRCAYAPTVHVSPSCLAQLPCAPLRTYGAALRAATPVQHPHACNGSRQSMQSTMHALLWPPALIALVLLASLQHPGYHETRGAHPHRHCPGSCHSRSCALPL